MFDETAGGLISLAQVPTDKPKESLEMVHRWLSGQEL